MPKLCAMICSRGVAPTSRPVRRSVIRSALCPAAPPVTLAVIRLAAIWPGTIKPKVSCVTLPSAPMGVMPVSPVTRQATMARMKLKRNGEHAHDRIDVVEFEAGDRERRRQHRQPHGEAPVEARAHAVLAPSARRRRADDAMVRMNEVSDDTTSSVTPGHNSHVTSGPYQAALAAPACAQPLAMAIGDRISQPASAPISSEMPARRPMMAPKPSISSEGSKAMPRLAKRDAARRRRAQGAHIGTEKGRAKRGPTAPRSTISFTTPAIARRAQQPAQAQGRLAPAGVDLAQGLGGGDAGGEGQLLALQHGFAQAGGDEHAEDRDQEHPHDQPEPGQLLAGQHGQRRDRRHQPAGDDGGGGRRRGLVDVVLAQGELACCGRRDASEPQKP